MSSQYASQEPAGFTNKIENVAIVGAGGQVGAHIAKALVAGGKHTVTALTRVGSTSKLPDGLTIKYIDYDSHEYMVSALRGQDFLVITLSVMAAPGTQSRLIAAAKEAGVHWIMPNEYGGDADNDSVAEDTKISLGYRAVRKEIKEAGLNFVALSCGFWYEFSLAGTEARYGFVFGKREVTFYDDGEQKITTSTWVQCGRAVRALLDLPVLPVDEKDEQLTLSRFRNNAVFIGSFHVSQRDMLDSVLRVTGSKEQDWTIRHEDVKARFKRGQGMLAQGNMVGFGILLYARGFYPDAAFSVQGKLHNKVLQLPEEDLDEATKVAVEMAKTFEGFTNGR